MPYRILQRINYVIVLDFFHSFSLYCYLNDFIVFCAFTFKEHYHVLCDLAVAVVINNTADSYHYKLTRRFALIMNHSCPPAL